MPPVQPYGIHWFRRDLRLKGNPALIKNCQDHSGRVLGVFCFDKKFLGRPDFSVNRFQFFLDTLAHLQDEMRAQGGDLLVMDIGPKVAFADLFSRLGQQSLPSLISWNRDYEPFAIARDTNMQKFFDDARVATYTDRDHVLIEPHEITKTSDPASPYQVFTPFSKRWLEIFRSKEMQNRVAAQGPRAKTPNFSLTWDMILSNADTTILSTYRAENAKHVTVPIPAAGSTAALKALKSFKEGLRSYSTQRDFPAVRGTSGFSIFFKNGSLTIAQVIAALELDKHAYGRKFFLELIWREFYYYVLAKYPHVETTAFQKRFANIKWQNNKTWFEAWKAGQTGFPIVDAGMRQLNTRGWMHNRVRMIVASFLTKDLLIDWRWGEQYFMEQLLDGDLAPNNGGWQWAASTGCDAQPYFRIFNPVLQSKKFDPKGEYIRKYVPELAHLDTKSIHEPKADERGSYPAPIVVHSEQRILALEMYDV